MSTSLKVRLVTICRRRYSVSEFWIHPDIEKRLHVLGGVVGGLSRRRLVRR